MRFIEFESLMSKRGVNSLAEIARALNTTPQAVSNWKSRDQVPYHIVAKIKNIKSEGFNKFSQNYANEDSISISDIFLTLAEQIKVIILVSFIFSLLTFTYVQFIQQDRYVSWAKLLLPDSRDNNTGGLAGLAGQFGVSIPSTVKKDLSSPSLMPQLLRSRAFAEKILEQKFYTKEFGVDLSLLSILTHGIDAPPFGKDTLIALAEQSLAKMIIFQKDLDTGFSTLTVTSSESILSKEIADITLSELDKLNRYYKSQSVNKKITFIEERIAAVKEELELSEQRLKVFNEKNRQISSPSLQLELDRFGRDVEVQKSIYLTLKQQLELGKIEEVQESSVMQILDEPQIPIGPIAKKLVQRVLVAAILGLVIGSFIGFIRKYLNHSDINERKKIRRIKRFFMNKSKDIFSDRRFFGTISIMMTICLPYFISYKSQTPTYFGRYSSTFMLINSTYIIFLLFSIILFIYLSRKKSNNI